MYNEMSCPAVGAVPHCTGPRQAPPVAWGWHWCGKQWPLALQVLHCGMGEEKG